MTFKNMLENYFLSTSWQRQSVEVIKEHFEESLGTFVQNAANIKTFSVFIILVNEN